MNSPADLHSQIQSALQCLTSSPEFIGQAQAVLLQWEEQKTDEYVVTLLSLVGCPIAAIRLAAILSLKAAVTRKWKDRGRGKLIRNGQTNQQILCEPVKHVVRQIILQLVLTGCVPSLLELHEMVTNYNGKSTIQMKYITNIDMLSTVQVDLLRDTSLQLNAAALLSKIGRMDLPLTFHELIPALVSGIQFCQEKIQHSSITQIAHTIFRTIQFNAMDALKVLLDEMSTQRLLVDKKYRYEIAKSHLGKIVEFGLIPALGADLSIETMLKYAISTSQVAGHLIVSSFSKLTEDPSLAAVQQHAIGTIHQFLCYWLPRLASPDTVIISTGMMKLLCIQSNFIVDLHATHKESLKTYVDSFLRLFYDSFIVIIGKDCCQSLGCGAKDRLVISFLQFIANVTSSTDDVLVAAFFTPSLIQSLVPQIILLFPSHMCINNGESEHDREYWQDNPESFYLWDAQKSSEDDIGCSAQNLFMALIESSWGKEYIIPWLTSLLTNVTAQQVCISVEAGKDATSITPESLIASMPLGCNKICRNMDQQLIMQWEAVYIGAGLAGDILETGNFTFKGWFGSILGPGLELFANAESKKNCLPVICRRIIWLLGCNAHKVDMSSSYNPMGSLVSILTKRNICNDTCIKLTAVQSLEALLPYYCEDRPDILQSILEPSISALYALACHCDDVENKTVCLELVSTLITYAKVSAGELPHDVLNAIASPLPSIWNGANDQNLLLKRNVLGIISCVASYVGPHQASILHPMALPMIDNSLQSDELVFLVEDALRLWYVFLQLLTRYDALIGKLFLHTGKLSKDLDHVIIVTKIAECYIVVGGKDFLNEYASELQVMLVNLIDEVNSRGQAYIALVTESLLKQFPTEGGLLLIQCGVMKKFIKACSISFSGSECSEPDRVIVLYLSAMARIFLASPQLLETAELSEGSFGVNEMISLYLLKFRVAGNGAHGLLFQKLWALLLLSFYPPSEADLCSSIVLNKSSEILSLFSYIINNADPNGSNLLEYDVDEDDETFIRPETHDASRQQISNKDVVIQTNFVECVSLKMGGLSSALGHELYQQFISHTNDEVLTELQNVMAKSEH